MGGCSHKCSNMHSTECEKNPETTKINAKDKHKKLQNETPVA